MTESRTVSRFETPSSVADTPVKHLGYPLLLLLLSWTTLSAEELVPLVGKPISGRLLSVSSDTLTFQNGDAPPVTYSFKEIGAVDFKVPVTALPKDSKYDLLELTDGSQFRLTQLKLTGKTLQFSPAGADGKLKTDLPMSSVFYFLRNADDTTQRDEFQKLLKSRGKRDLFVVKTSSGLNPISGTLLQGNETGDRVDFEREDGQKVTLPLSRASGGLIFNQPSKDQVLPTLCKVIDVQGNLLFATQVELVGTGLKVRTVSGATIEYPSLQAISKLDFSQGNLQYLSDLTPAVDYPPADKDGPLGEQFPFQPTVQSDKALFSPEIVLDGKKYTKGFTMPRGAIATFKLDGTYREFKSIVGILDGNNRDTWALRLTIDVDGRTVFNEVITKKAKSRTLGLNIKDAKELKIAVEPVGEYLGDQINLAEARLQK
jgi:hypothetical protein